MGIFEKLFGKKKPKNTEPVFNSRAPIRYRRNDPGCPINVAQSNIDRYGRGPVVGIITKSPNHPVCQLCTRRYEKTCF